TDGRRVEPRLRASRLPLHSEPSSIRCRTATHRRRCVLPQRGANAVRVVAYLRVSTDRQDNGIDAQRAAILRWAEYRQHEVVAWLEDPDVSGTRPLSKRKAGAVALSMLANGEADMLAVA